MQKMSDKEGSAAEAGAPTSEEADRLDRSVKRAKKLEVREGIRSKPLDAGVSQPAAQYKDMLIGGSQNTNGDFVDGLGWQPNVRRKRGEASWARDPVRNPSGDKTAQERGKANARPIQRFRGIEAHEAQCTSIPGCSSILNVNFELAQRILFQGKGQMEPGPKAQAQESLAGTVVPVTPTPTLGVETVQSNGPDFPGGNAAPMVVEESTPADRAGGACESMAQDAALNQALS
ncbi:hypothetical protein CDL15_Pgr014177 [Punica granatum]|uniref:Uncharacterized protein n=1 Tax=Punica granatum TaxID=22663 RepID=A0A218XIQ9_PUNGR|nr:hypothetical protein CDL15_Pgr014177 [Punica granatum]